MAARWVLRVNRRNHNHPTDPLKSVGLGMGLYSFRTLCHTCTSFGQPLSLNIPILTYWSHSVHQKLSVKDVNLKKQSVLVCNNVAIWLFLVRFIPVHSSVWYTIPLPLLQANTELTLLPLTSTGKVWKVNLNCKQCRILGITVNGQHVANYSYADATLRITPLESKKWVIAFVVFRLLLQ